MAMRPEKLGELMTAYGNNDAELDIPNERNTRRRNLPVFLVTLAAVTTAVWIALGMPGDEVVIDAIDVVLKLISS